MLIISQFLKNLSDLSNNIFQIQTFLEPLSLNNKVSEKLNSLLSEPIIADTIKSINEKLIELNSQLSPICSSAKKEAYQKYSHDDVIPYASFKQDEPPIRRETSIKQSLSFETILANNDIKPIKRRQPLDFTDCCPFCGAPNEYIYSNSKGKQYKCKCCSNLFSIHPNYHDEISHHCPHCGYKLFLHHERHNYDVLVCSNDFCPFYLKNKKLVENNQADTLKTNTNGFKLHYTFRLFNFTLDDIKQNESDTSYVNSKFSLNKIHHSSHTLGLILTYYVNYGLSSRKTAQILEEIHDIKISYQTVINYAEAAAQLVENLNENYKYDLSNTITGDETYIKVSGKTNYVFFFSDTIKKIITSYRIYANRDTLCAVKSLYQTFKKFKPFPNDLKIITDANPIYNAAQVFYKMNNINFDLYQVIGLQNKDQISKEYRSFKQCEERLNRTYKFNYYGTNGYGSYRGANIYIVLFVGFYNFLRKHSSLKNKVPIPVDEISQTKLMPHKWCQLLKMATAY